MNCAPVALFVYNRPDHAKRTLEALARNSRAKETDLFIFSDAPKNNESVVAVNQVRQLISHVEGFNSVSVFSREKNYGLAASIIDGVTRLCDDYGRVIVLEDDLITSPFFLEYMNDALNFYEKEERVISVHGYIYPVETVLPETFFLRGADCWGWATWKRGWELFEPDGNKLLSDLLAQGEGRNFNFDNAFDYMDMLRRQVDGKNDSWAIRWYASAYLKNKLTLYPGETLVENIGTDGSGIHCGVTDIYSGKIRFSPLEIKEIALDESAVARAAIKKYFLGMKPSIFRRIVRKLLQRRP